MCLASPSKPIRKEFPIRFDLLDTMGGGNLIAGTPHFDYAKDNFGIHYTQEESYYIGSQEDATVYGFKNRIDRAAMLNDLKQAQAQEVMFDAEEYVNIHPPKARSFLFHRVRFIVRVKTPVLDKCHPFCHTFKLWDWGRLGLDGKPNPLTLNA